MTLAAGEARAQKGAKVAVVRGDASASTHIMMQNLKETVDDYLGGANLWAKKKDYWLIWIGWSNGNAAVRQDFAKNGKDFQKWIADGGAFVGDTFSSDMHEIYELLPGKVATRNQHASIETGHVVDKTHPLVTTPNDITDDKFYANWAWTAGDIYTSWEGYTVVATQDDKKDSPPLWLVHNELPVVVTTMQPTWSGHMRPPMVENIWHYVKNFKPQAVNPGDKLPVTWAKVKSTR
jgi:hypothetical protein